MIDLRWRSAQPELMDAEVTDLATVEACLRDLERINRWTGAYRITLRWLERVLDRHRPTRPLVVVDVGSGYGDMLRRIAAFAERRGVAVDLIGVDLNPHAAVPQRERRRRNTRSAISLKMSSTSRRRSGRTWSSAPSSPIIWTTRGWSASSTGWTSAPGSAG